MKGVICQECGEPATHYVQKWMEFQMVSGQMIRSPSFKEGYCLDHRPFGAKPIEKPKEVAADG
jgi:hypothetical protein